MDHDHMNQGGPPQSPGVHHHSTMMHMSFYWGSSAEILFSGWPGTRSGMYALALIFVFALSVLVEWLSHAKLIKPGTSNAVAGVAQTAMHAARMGLAYLVMLAVMSFNVGVLLVVVAGHSLGFLLFGSRVFRKPDSAQRSDLPPMSC